MFRRIGYALSVSFLAIAGSIMTAEASHAVIKVGGYYGSADYCYNAINNSDNLKTHRSFCYHNEPGLRWEIFQWTPVDPATFIGGDYGRLDGCYNGINGDAALKRSMAFCNFGSDRVYHIYLAQD